MHTTPRPRFIRQHSAADRFAHPAWARVLVLVLGLALLIGGPLHAAEKSAILLFGEQLTADPIFADDFETGELSPWSSTFSPPWASFAAVPAAPGGSLQWYFDASSSFDGDGFIQSRLWSFGDGNSASTTMPSHTYTEPGTFAVTLTVFDDDGLASSVGGNFDIYGPTSFLDSTSPLDGEADVAVGREIVLRFSAPLAPASVSTAAFDVTADGAEIAVTVHLSTSGRLVTLFPIDPLPADAQVVVEIDGSLLYNVDGGGVDVNGNGLRGGLGALVYRTVDLGVVPGTRVCGRVLASDDVADVPLEGVTISVAGAPALFATSDATGNFCLDPAPGGNFFGHVDGRTALATLPAGAFYPAVVESWRATAGQMTHVGNLYLPLVAPGTLQSVSEVDDTVIEPPSAVLDARPDLAGLSITVPAGALFTPGGASGGMVGLAPVEPDRLPAPLPAGMEPTIVVTVQTDGGTNFATPAPICFPNLADPNTGLTLAPGERQGLLSYDHDAGRWRSVGTMTVTGDGTRICSDPGSGILAPGWHCPCPPPLNPPPPPRPKPDPPPGPPDPDPPPPPPDAPPPEPPPEPDPPDPCPEGGPQCARNCADAATTCGIAAGLAGVGCAFYFTGIGVVTCAGGAVLGAGGCAYFNNSCSFHCGQSCGGRAAVVATLPIETLPLGTPATGDPVVDQVLATIEQINQLTAPLILTGNAPSQALIDQITALLQQADSQAGGDAQTLLESSLADHTAQITGIPPGNAPHYPIRYMAEAVDDDELIQLRGLTEAFGQYTLFVPVRATLATVFFHDRFTHSFGALYPAENPSGTPVLDRFFLHPIDGTFADFDGDGLVDVVERVYGTDPGVADSDGDGTNDGDEVFLGTDPLGLDVQIGDVISAEISAVFEIDRYGFPALAGQKVFFDVQAGGSVNIDWILREEGGAEVFNRPLNTDWGVQELAAGGTYSLLIGSETGNFTGPYQIQIWDVPPPDTFAIALDDPISDGVPAAGAGNLESPGVRDVYTFDATAGQKVFFDLQAGGDVGVDWILTDPLGGVVLDRPFNTDQGVHELPLDGTYTLTIGADDNDHFGTYQFQLWNVPASQSFAIQIGDLVADGAPSAGAGNLESPGVRDVYTFSATAGQKVFFDLQAGGNVGVDWILTDPLDGVVFDRPFNNDAAARELVLGGTYTLTIGADDNDHFGAYQVQLWDIPSPQSFAIAVGDVISNGVPSVGAGNLESPAVRDVYTFSAAPGQSVLFDLQGGGNVGVDWILIDSGGTEVFNRPFNTDTGPYALILGGTYTLTIGADDNDHFGTYQFQIVVQP